MHDQKVTQIVIKCDNKGMDPTDPYFLQPKNTRVLIKMPVPGFIREASLSSGPSDPPTADARMPHGSAAKTSASKLAMEIPERSIPKPFASDAFPSVG